MTEWEGKHRMWLESGRCFLCDSTILGAQQSPSSHQWKSGAGAKKQSSNRKHNETAFSCHFLTSSFLKPNTAVLSGGKKIPCCFWPNKKRRKNKSQCSSRYLWVTVWAGLRRAMPRLHAVKPCSCRQGAAVAQWPQKCLARVRQIKPNTCSFPIFTQKAPREILEANI